MCEDVCDRSSEETANGHMLAVAVICVNCVICVNKAFCMQTCV